MTKHYTDFQGRVARRDFWTYIAVYVALAVIVAIVQGMVGLRSARFGAARLVPADRGDHRETPSGYGQERLACLDPHDPGPDQHDGHVHCRRWPSAARVLLLIFLPFCGCSA